MLWKWTAGLALGALPLAGGCLQQSNNAPVVAAPAVEPIAVSNAGVATLAEAAVAPANVPAITNLANAVVTPVSTEKPLPADIHPSSPTAEVVRLANSGVDEAVMLTFVTNSPSYFNLGASEIIYLNDIGVPGPVVTAMIMRDQTLKQLAAAPAPAPAAPAPAVPMPPPEQVAPQPDTAAVAAPEPAPAPPANVNYTTFYDSLAPYGTWVDVEGYGRCWQPTVVATTPGWRPYYQGGRWVYTDCGWYWLSDYSWGWAPFHYGRWFQHSHWGWCWAPDLVWGPSWVSWRYNDAYCGWAPLPPAACYTPGFGFTWYGSSVGVGFGFGLSAGCYSFVGWNNFCSHNVYHHGVSPHHGAQIYGNTTIINNYGGHNNVVVNNGVPVDRVRSFTRTDISRVTIRDSSVASLSGGRPEQLDASRGTLTVFRPRPQPATRATATTIDRARLEVGRPASPVATTATRSTLEAASPPSAPARGTAGSFSGQPVTRQGSPSRIERPASRFGSSTVPAPAAPAPATSLAENTTPPVTSQPGVTPDRRATTPSRPAVSSAPQTAPATTANRTASPLILRGSQGSYQRSPTTQTWTPSAQPSAAQPAARPAETRATPSRVQSPAAVSSAPAQNSYSRQSISPPAAVSPSAPSASAPQAPSRSTWQAPSATSQRFNNQLSAPRLETPRASSPESRFSSPPASVSRPAMTPSYQAPAREMSAPQAAPRVSAPAPSPAPSYSAPRVSAPESRPTYSAPASRSQGDSSGGRGPNR